MTVKTFDDGYIQGLSMGMFLNRIVVPIDKEPGVVCSLCGQRIKLYVKNNTRDGKSKIINPAMKNWFKIGEGLSCDECYRIHNHNKKFKFEKLK